MRKKKETVSIQPCGIAYTIVPKEYIDKNPYYDKSLLVEMIKTNKNNIKFIIV